MRKGRYWFHIRKIEYNNRTLYLAKVINSKGDEAFMEIPENFSTYSVPPNKEYMKYENCTERQNQFQ
ncbi:unnamed protein product [Nippostrongylus brasiliensis]|uniref:Phage protein n=1 Tax=Nippostrongylus brasiliensis TaxID=27835 RepID=A0A0N4YNM0_NIPBR|nr:unnamed protein product [Nippostrongylus brasiliensis]